ncbi:MAG: ABC transporter transmembrane domain-containing protein [Rhodobacteraceae bacterium]|nr:ABC transporter transmembrane domain-containing protein [Paracoccaceae bacterium]
MRAQQNLARGAVASPPVPGPVLAASLTLNILSLLLPIAILQIFDRVIPFHSEGTLLLLFIGLCVGAVFEFVLRWTRITLLGAAAEAFSLQTHRAFLQSTLRANPAQFQKTSSAVHMERFAAIARLRDFYSGQNRHLAMDLPFTVVFILMIALIGGWLVLVPLASAAGVLLFSAILRQVQEPVFEARKNLDARRYSFLAEVLAQLPTVKANTMEHQLQRRFEMLQRKTADTSHRLILCTGLSQNYGAVFSQLSVASIGLFGSYLVIAGQIGVAELAACMLLNGRTVQPLMKLLGLRAQSESIAVARQKLNDAMSEPAAASPQERPEMLAGKIEIKDLGLTQPNQAEPMFSGLNTTVEPGQMLLLDGASGRSAEGFIDLLVAQRGPTSGRILIDGQVPDAFAATRGEGGIVAVDALPVLFAGTILENISAFGDGARIEYALHLSKMLSLEETVHRLPLGYNTPVGDGRSFDDNPSNSQLISLVRALALRPKLLVLNEPSALLEDAARRAFARGLAELAPRPTIVVATPDPQLKALADVRLDLSEPNGTHITAWLADEALETGMVNRAAPHGTVAGAA